MTTGIIDQLLNRHYPDIEPIAVIGYAGRFPEARDSEAYWANLVAGRDCSRTFSCQELLDAGIPLETIDDPNYVPRGTVIEDAETFDAVLFGYSRQEAELIDPQQRLFLQIVWHALEHAGYAPRSVPHKTGIFGSSRISTYPGQEEINLSEIAHVRNLQSLMGNDKDYMATRVAYKLNLRGPALTIQTACSSSLVAVHMACESLRSGECDMAVAGGVAVSFPQTGGYLYRQGMIFSPDGHCRPFDVRAQGTYAGNGCGAVVLRRLPEALRDGDPIAAVILGSAVNNDGSGKVGYTAPSVTGQRAVIADAWALAGVTSQQIGMIEAHGTATSLGDSIEIQALRDVFHRRDQGPDCALGSVKGNMGHLDTAAGIASLIKTVMAVERGAIPLCVNFSQANPDLRLQEGPFYIPDATQSWDHPARIAGVSSFGIGGTNCHMVVAALPPALQQHIHSNIAVSEDGERVLLLSANSETALQYMARDYAQKLPLQPDDIVNTALHGRQLDLPWRLAVPVCDETSDALRAFASGEEDVLVHKGCNTPGRQVWLFSGQGAQWPGMAAEWYASSRAFADHLEQSLAVFEAMGDNVYASNLQQALMTPENSFLQKMEYAQPAIIIFELAMAAHWQALGLVPDMVIGHSAGDFAASVIAGHYTETQILPLARRRGALMDRCDDGAMLAVFASEDEVMKLAERLELDLAVYNGARYLVFSGTRASVAQMATELEALAIRSTFLAVSGAAHSRLLDPILDEFQQAASFLHAQDGVLPFISGLTGEVVEAGQLNMADFWRHHMRCPVSFVQCLRKALSCGAGLFLEMGPDAPLTGIGQREFPNGARWVACARRNQPANRQYNAALMQLYVAGLDLPWPSLFAVDGRRGRAPLYPFARERYWHEAARMAAPALSAYQGPALPTARSVAAQQARELDLPRLSRLYDHVTKLHAIYVNQMVRHCVGDRIDHGVTVLEILREGRLLPRYRQLLVRLLNSCVEDGYLKEYGGTYITYLPPPHKDRDALLDALRMCCEGLDVIAETVARAGDNLTAMMRGDVEPVAVIFPEGASSGVEVLYQDFSFGRYFNRIAAGILTDLLHDQGRKTGAKTRKYRILEVGGGTGGTTVWLLPVLAGRQDVTYVFTDISSIFTRRAEQKFADYEFIEFCEFDLQKNARSQGFAHGDYDLVIAANVVHATQHIGETLENLLPLLRPGGKMLLREITRPMRLFDFVFGPLVLPLHDEEARGGELFLTTAHWRQACLAAGFERVEWLPEDGTATSDMSEHVILATAPGVQGAEAAITGAIPLADNILGQNLANDGLYLADWSDCAGSGEAWRVRMAEACAEMARRHGHGGAISLPAIPEQAPDWLGLVRLKWSVKPPERGQVELRACDPDGLWHCLTPIKTRPDHQILPALLPTPQTHYDLVWRCVTEELTESAPFCGSFRLCANVMDGVEEALAGAGVALDAMAENVLLVIPELSSDVAEPEILEKLAEQILDMMARNITGRLLVVTRSAWAVKEGETVSAVHHALWGLLRTAGVELSRQNMDQQSGSPVAVVDLAAESGWQDIRTGLQAVALGESWVAVRQDQVWTPRLVPHHYEAPALSVDGLSSCKGWHIVTGGLGDLGRLSATWLAGRGASRIALLVRQEHGDTEDFVSSLKQHYDSVIEIIPCDMADPAALKAVLDRLEAESGIAGIIHAAGLLDDVPISEIRAGRLAPVLSVKAYAAQAMYKHLCRLNKPAYMLLYSSAAAVMGSAGQAIHALASGYLDGLAYETAGRKDCAVTIMSIAWGAWDEAGRAKDPALQKRLAKDGMGVLDTGEGLWHLEQGFCRAAPYRLAMRVLPESLGESHRHLLGLTQQARRNILPQNPAMMRKNESGGAVISGLSPEQLKDEASVAQWLGIQIAAQLRLENPSCLSPEQDLMKFGLDSLLFLELTSAVQRHLGVRLDAEQAYKNLTIQGLSRLVVSQANEVRDENSEAQSLLLQHDAAGRYEPFPLTPIQHAYWMGRTNLIDYGGVACHVLFEWDLHHDRINPERFERAWNDLIRRHDMLRMVITEDGRQRILPEVATYKIARRDMSGLSEAQRQDALDALRHELSYRVLSAECWPLFELVATELGGGQYRLHMNLDLLLFDVQSFKVMMDDLAAFYQGSKPEPLEITFRDYVMDEQARRRDPAWLKSWCYWQNRLPDMPPAPLLPLSEEAGTGVQPRFTTYQGMLDHDSWARLRGEWQNWGVTPSAGLMTLFAWTLERWARWPAFTLNLTFFNRWSVHPQIRRLIGDFTSVLLVDFDLGDQDSTLRQSVEQTQQKLRAHLANNAVNGVELLREYGRLRGQSGQSLMPVVFTSMLGMTLDGLAIDQAMTAWLGDPVHVFTQTPQVWLDHQVMETADGLAFNWYCMDEVFDAGVAQSMFADYCAVLRSVAAEPGLMAQKGLWKQAGAETLNPFERRKWPVSVGKTSLDLRDIEDVVRRDDDVLQAEIGVDPGGDGLLVKVVGAERACDPGPFPVFAKGDLSGLAGLDKAGQAHFDAIWSALEARALQGIAQTLASHGLFVQKGQSAGLDDICHCLGVLPRFERIMRQWLHAMSEAGWLTCRKTEFTCLQPLDQLPPARPLPASSWGDIIAAYLDDSIAHHTALLQGTCSALELFFADDAISGALYVDNPAAQCMAGNVRQILREIVRSVSEDKALHVLEVGAGSGMTAASVMDVLGGHLKAYHFTDVSPLFLNAARQRFAGEDRMTCGIFDINQPVDYKKHPVQGYDLVVASQVMHDASHVVQSLQRLGRVMRPGGLILLVEATYRHSIMQMASVGFIEGLGTYRDFRVLDDRAMLNICQWREALGEAGFSIEFAWPEQDVSPIHQHVILARLVRSGLVDSRRIEERLISEAGVALPVLHVQRSEMQTMFLSGSVSSDAVSATLSVGGNSPAEVVTKEQGALENQVAIIWQSFLGRPVQSDSDFFQLGGDSLIATRMVAQLNRAGLAGASLQSLFVHPTLGGFCETLRLEEDRQIRVNNLVPLIRADLSKGPSNPRVFVVHASDGGVSSYLAMARALDVDVWGVPASDQVDAGSLRELAEGYLRKVTAQSGDAPLTLIGWSYGATVVAEMACLLHENAEYRAKYDATSIRLVLIDPVCGANFAVDDLSALMALIVRQYGLVLEENWEALAESARITAFMRAAIQAGLTDKVLSAEHARQWLMRNYRLLDLLSKHQPGAPVPVPCLWIEADRHPEDWIPAQEDWSAWKAQARVHVMEATHWQLMEDQETAQEIADLIRQWLSQTNRQDKICQEQAE